MERASRPRRRVIFRLGAGVQGLAGPARLAGLLAAGVLVLSPAPAAKAQDVPVPPGERANFSIQPVEGGLMKLDTRTGALSFCSRRPGAAAETGTGWACEAVPDDRAALEAEIGRLQARIAALEGGRGGVTPGVPDIMVPPGGGAGSSTRPPVPPQAVPPDDETRLSEDARRKLDEAMVMAEQVFRRFLGMIERLRSEDGPPPEAAPKGPPPMGGPTGPLPRGEPL